MHSCPDDFAMGRAAGYRAALVSGWDEMLSKEPKLRELFAQAFLAGLEREFIESLPSALASDEFMNGLHLVEAELRALLRDPAVTET
ncbi:hypothetical protein [Caldimonas tepidiphila]|uniref:hypothetical protein n=1 Tax=Caldimonas tepidiphila TaxID=2315841 RepID=UPI00130089F0|nr:hypothetical protein [Caldimonas tepidiphila]